MNPIVSPASPLTRARCSCCDRALEHPRLNFTLNISDNDADKLSTMVSQLPDEEGGCIIFTGGPWIKLSPTRVLRACEAFYLIDKGFIPFAHRVRQSCGVSNCVDSEHATLERSDGRGDTPSLRKVKKRHSRWLALMSPEPSPSSNAHWLPTLPIGASKPVPRPSRQGKHYVTARKRLISQLKMPFLNPQLPPNSPLGPKMPQASPVGNRRALKRLHKLLKLRLKQSLKLAWFHLTGNFPPRGVSVFPNCSVHSCHRHLSLRLSKVRTSTTEMLSSVDSPGSPSLLTSTLKPSATAHSDVLTRARAFILNSLSPDGLGLSPNLSPNTSDKPIELATSEVKSRRAQLRELRPSSRVLSNPIFTHFSRRVVTRLMRCIAVHQNYRQGLGATLCWHWAGPVNQSDSPLFTVAPGLTVSGIRAALTLAVSEDLASIPTHTAEFTHPDPCCNPYHYSFVTTSGRVFEPPGNLASVKQATGLTPTRSLTFGQPAPSMTGHRQVRNIAKGHRRSSGFRGV